MAAPTTRAEQARQTRQSILDTAHELFAVRGYDGTSLQMIADALGVTKAHVYYYFRTKAEILHAVVEARLQPMRELLTQAESIHSRRERTLFLIDAYVQMVVANRHNSRAGGGDPAVYEDAALVEAIEAVRQRARRVLIGERPSVEDELAFALVMQMSEHLREFSHLDDHQLHEALRNVGLRLLRLRG